MNAPSIARTSLFALATLIATATTNFAQNNKWHVELPGFKVAGNLYYVGTADLAIYLIATPQGNILINANYPQDLPLLRKSVEQLGFKYADTKILLISHAHGDHDAAAGQIQKETGARVMVMAPDVAAVESTDRGRPGAKVNRVLHDGDTVELGGAKLVAHLTPGHTPGCTTWTMQVQEGTKKLDAVFVGSPNVNRGYILVGDKRNYPTIAEDYAKAFAFWQSAPVDLFLGAHGAYFNLEEKYAKLKPGAANPFIDPAGYKRYISEREATFRTEWERQKQNPGSPAP
jgi:metallo-beta-lactamase class B